ncbi:DNA internalization-related competence protein ComEC/Rec2 [Cohnella hongkongensis]|uniref:DNA internalization-related competence protein ComEC/Rec2 n=1 Tax=Cohnella hongkongensis TaxID=178337 RepID=A0ABV9FBG6_9BACL
MDRRPLVAVSGCWIAGTALLSLFPGKEAIWALAALLLTLAALALAGLASPKLTLVCAAALLLAHAERAWTEHRLASDLPAGVLEESGGAVELEGRISTVVEVDGDLAAFRLKAETIRIGAAEERRTKDVVVVRIKLADPSEPIAAEGWRRGDRVRLSGTLEPPGQAGNFGAFDYRSYLRRQGVFWQLSVQGLESAEQVRAAAPWPMKPLRLLDELRREIGGLADRLYPGGDAGYMKGLVAGIRSDLDPEQFDQFAKLGLTHVLAISGLHVGVIVFLLLQLWSWLRLTRERSLELTIALMPVYMMITGASPSAVRACLMAMIALSLARIHALKDGLHLLLAAAMAMLMWKPAMIEDVSFQLSFIVTAGLILFVPALSELIPIRWTWLRGTIAVTVTAQLVSFPVSVYYFHSMHLLSLPANFLLVPFISAAVMPLGLASLALGGVWLPLGVVPAKLATMGNRLTFGVVDWLDGFIGWRTIWPQPSLLWTVCAYALMGIGLAGLRRRSRRLRLREWWNLQTERRAESYEGGPATAPLEGTVPGPTRSERLLSLARRAAFALACAAWLLWGAQPAWWNRSAEVSFLNVGQGDSILIRTGYGKHILVDAGGTVSFRKPGDEWRERKDPYEVGRKLLVPLLLRRGVSRLDALVLTHMDTDHIGGARAVLDHIPVRAVLFNGTLKNSPGALALMQTVADKRIPAYAVGKPLVWQVDPSAVVSVLYPVPTDSDAGSPVRSSEDQNDRSVVLLASLYGRHFLLPGDLEARGESEVVDADYAAGEGGEDGSQIVVDVLKAGHHGSKTSTTGLWVDYWQPRETVISVGRNNLYGHPNPDVLRRLEKAGSLIWRTDTDGEIQYRIAPDGAMRRRTLFAAGSGES